jgi:hypothetical protein
VLAIGESVVHDYAKESVSIYKFYGWFARSSVGICDLLLQKSIVLDLGADIFMFHVFVHAVMLLRAI